MIVKGDAVQGEDGRVSVIKSPSPVKFEDAHGENEMND